MPPAVILAVALVALPLAALGAIIWRRALLMALPFTVVLSGLAIPVGRTSLRLDQLTACLLVIPLGASLLIGARRLKTDATTWWLAAILGVNAVASVANSPALSYSVLQCANLASVWVIYVLLINFLDTREDLEAFFDRWLVAGILATGVGIVAFLLAVVGVPVGGAEVSASAAERLTNAYGAYGTMSEPNIFGSFAAAHLVLAVGLLVMAPQMSLGAARAARLRWLAALSAAALVFSFTRAAWLAAIAAALLFAVLGPRTIGVDVRLRRVLLPLGVIGAMAIVLLLLPGTTGSLFRFKLVNLANLQSQTVSIRLITYAMALQQTLEHPFIGWGTFTFAPLVAQGTDFQQFDNWRNLWIGNYLLLALHDTGMVGLVLWSGLLGAIVLRGVRTARALRDIDFALAGRTLALTVAVASLLVSFLTTSGFSMGYPWLLIGLLGAHAHDVRAATPDV